MNTHRINQAAPQEFHDPLWCPHCGTQHFDRGEWATRLHHTHLCVPEQGGCGKTWTEQDYVFGIERGSLPWTS